MKWTYPTKDLLFMRIEVFVVAVLAACVFLMSFFQLDQQWFPALLLTLVFIGIYVIISLLIQEVRQLEEKYVMTPTHLHITRKSRGKQETLKIPRKKIAFHRVDKFFLGGYVVLKDNKRHPIYFNTLKEANQFTKKMPR